MANKQDTYRKTLPVGQMFISTGTWARVTGAGAPYYSHTAAAETTKINIPIDTSAQELSGLKLTTIEVPIRLATAAAVSTPTAVLYRRDNLAVAAAGVNMAASTVTTTKTGLTLTAAATDRKITVTVSSPANDTSNDYVYNLLLTFNCATTTALRVYDAQAYFTVAT